MKLLLLPYYSRKSPSARYRLLQYIPALESQGIDCHVSFLFDDNYQDHRFSPNQKSLLVFDIMRGFARRLSRLLSSEKFDLVFLQREGFPYALPVLPQLLTRHGIPYVVDCDDAWFHLYDQHKISLVRSILGEKIGEIMRQARSVVVGSHYLGDYAQKWNKSVHLIPTSIDIDLYPKKPPLKRTEDVFTIGWIGSPTTTQFLKILESPLKEFCSRYPAQVVIIGAGPLALDIPNLKRIEWREETEVEETSLFDVGVMPVFDAPFERGKCGFKLIQYMGCWEPTIASPIGENRLIVEDGVTGFHARNDREWYSTLVRLYENPEMRKAMGEAGRKKIESDYNMKKNSLRLAEVFRDAVRSDGR